MQKKYIFDVECVYILVCVARGEVEPPQLRMLGPMNVLQTEDGRAPIREAK